jgi:hypothetical protein
MLNEILLSCRGLRHYFKRIAEFAAYFLCNVRLSGDSVTTITFINTGCQLYFKALLWFLDKFCKCF